jgi:hypothetical protein
MKKENSSKADFALGKENFKYLIIGALIIIVGFLLMMGGGSNDPNVFNTSEIFSPRRIILAPIVVMFGFAFEIWAIMKKPKDIQE